MKMLSPLTEEHTRKGTVLLDESDLNAIVKEHLRKALCLRRDAKFSINWSAPKGWGITVEIAEDLTPQPTERRIE